MAGRKSANQRYVLLPPPPIWADMWVLTEEAAPINQEFDYLWGHLKYGNVFV